MEGKKNFVGDVRGGAWDSWALRRYAIEELLIWRGRTREPYLWFAVEVRGNDHRDGDGGRDVGQPRAYASAIAVRFGFDESPILHAHLRGE